jgi:hypothetical protein
MVMIFASEARTRLGRGAVVCGCDIAPIPFQGMLETEVLHEAISAAKGGPRAHCAILHNAE